MRSCPRSWPRAARRPRPWRAPCARCPRAARVRIDQRRMHDRCAAIVRHAVLPHRVENQLRFDLAQAHIGARIGGHVQGKHQPLQWNIAASTSTRHAAACPRSRCCRSHSDRRPGDGRPRPWGCRWCRGVVERNGVPFIGGRLPCIFRVASGDEALILRRADALAAPEYSGSSTSITNGFALRARASARRCPRIRGRRSGPWPRRARA